MSTIVDTFIAPPCHEAIGILYQDEHLLLINKPSGLLSLSGKNPQNLDSVHHRLEQQFPGCTRSPSRFWYVRADGGGKE
jgi:tRNA pseudouridine32 synthase/23S rRNA pseudouridine746 synthase